MSSEVNLNASDERRSECRDERRSECRERCRRTQKHVHEVLGSTRIAELCNDPHNHRFAIVSDEAIEIDNSHVHKVKFRTDFYEDHYHEFMGTSGPAIPVGDGRHIHFIKAVTQEADGHKHKFRVATLIDNPIGD